MYRYVYYNYNNFRWQECFCWKVEERQKCVGWYWNWVPLGSRLNKNEFINDVWIMPLCRKIDVYLSLNTKCNLSFLFDINEELLQICVLFIWLMEYNILVSFHHPIYYSICHQSRLKNDQTAQTWNLKQPIFLIVKFILRK